MDASVPALIYRDRLARICLLDITRLVYVGTCVSGMVLLQRVALLIDPHKQMKKGGHVYEPLY